MLKPTVPAWCGCRSVSTVTSRTCGELGWGQVAWQPGRPPARVADRTLGALLNSSTRTGHGNTRSQLAGVRETQELESGSLYVLMFGVTKLFFYVASAGMDTYWHTHIPGEVKKVRDSLWSVVISLISVVTLMSRPTTGGTLWKPNNLTQTQTLRKWKGQERESISKSKGY